MPSGVGGDLCPNRYGKHSPAFEEAPRPQDTGPMPLTRAAALALGPQL